jgi:aryl-alcohol dehydrogenase-like predicted oxidoreductase
MNEPPLMQQRPLGARGPAISAIGLGCWAIGGLSLKDGREQGWSGTEDAESIAAIHAALDLGVDFLDTADVYGAGHSERLIGTALEGRRHTVVLATKFGKVFDEARRERTEGTDAIAAAIVAACEASLRRLRTDWIDLYQLHDGKLPLAQVPEVLDTLERLVAAGKIRAYGWSTDDVARAEAFAAGAHCAAIQHRANLLEDAPAMRALCRAGGLASVCRSPLGQGLLTGKFDAGTRFPDTDLRAGWRLNEGARAAQLQALARVRELLTCDGRSLAQGALGWLLAQGGHVLPIPGFKNRAQVQDNAGVLARGPLPPDVVRRIDTELAALAAA